ncbi:hypothetical protein [Thermus caldilimi]|uniref:hypothetical protein n=1 Tax=Thermus caldilimi TaxID=2483360 RepID=UPI00142DD9AD|nr:hypothetical protein [Thermus caldilimi]
MRKLLELVERGRTCEAAVLAGLMVKSPWFYKDQPERPAGGWRELDPLVELFSRQGDAVGAEAAIHLKRRASWPEARWLELLHRRLGKEVSWEDLSFAVRWLREHRLMLERLGIGFVVPGPEMPKEGRHDEGEVEATTGGGA